jgi:hypothetical protein
MPSLKITGSLKVSSLRKRFRGAVGVNIAVYDQAGEAARDDMTVIELRDRWPRQTEIKLVGQSKISAIEAHILQDLGIRLDILNPDGSPADKDLTLSAVKLLYAEPPSGSERDLAHESGARVQDEPDGDVLTPRAAAEEDLEFLAQGSYPAEFFDKDNAFVENMEMIRIKQFPNIFRPGSSFTRDDVFRTFTPDEAVLIVNAIRKRRVMPYLGFIKDAIPQVGEANLKAPFWFVPFVIYDASPMKIGASLYFEQNGIWANIESAGKYDLLSLCDDFTAVSLASGIGTEGNESQDTVTTLSVESFNQAQRRFGQVTMFEPHGRGVGSQLMIIQALWESWEQTVEASRGASIFMHALPSEVFHSFDDVLEWARDEVSCPDA